jgi:ABC-2 type transport system permease protein
MTAFFRLTYTELKLLLRDVGSVFFMLAIPLFVLVIFGMSYGARDSLLPSISVAISLALNALYVIPTYLGAYRERGILRRFSTTPMPAGALLAAQLVIHLLVTVAAVLLVLATAAVIGIAPPRHAAGAITTFGLGITAMFSIGILIAALAPGGRIASGIGVLLYWPMAFLGGLTVPKEQMPAVLARIGEFTPLGAFRQSIQDTWTGSAPDPLNLVIMAIYAVIFGVLAAKYFRWE